MKIPRLFCLTLLFALVFSVHAEEKPPIKFGVITSLTGPVAEWGENTQRGMELALKELNAAGGVRGRPLQLIYEDMADMDSKKAATAAQKLLQIDMVNALLTQWSEDTEVAWPIALRQNVITLTYAAGSSEITKGRDLLFRVWPSDDVPVRRVVDFAARKGKKTLCILTQQSPYFESMKVVAAAEWVQINGQTPKMVEHTADVTDFRPYLLQLRNCDSVLTLSNQSLLPTIYRQLRTVGTKALLISYPGISAPSVREAAGSAADGIVYAAYLAATPDFSDRFLKLYGKKPGLPAAAAYDSVKLLAQAIEAKGISASDVSAGLKEIKSYVGASGTVTFTPDGDRAPLEPQLWRISGAGRVTEEIEE